MSQHTLATTWGSFVAGNLSRRVFIQRLLAMGVAPSVVAALANNAHAQATPEVTSAERPQAGTETQERGAGGELRLIQWQAPTQLSPHVSSGVKDYLAALPVVEPLIHYLTDARMVPNLIQRVPTQENGLLNDDLTQVTLELLPGLLWNDGEPVTAQDIAFTVEWVLNSENGATSYTQFEPIERVEVIDELTARVTFREPNPFWMTPFAGTSTGYLYPRHALEGGAAAHDAFLQNPIGTGPYRVASFVANDEVRYEINEHYREPNKPFFSSVYLKGGGDPASAARSVMQTGEYDYAWYLQTEMRVLTEMQSDDGPGEILPYPGATVERINFQFADPATEVNGQRSEINTPNPRLTDPAVRAAIASAINRELIVTELYGEDMSVAANIVQGDPATYSPNTSWEYNPERARQILEDAGWVLNGDVRERAGVRLELTYASEVNALSQKTQAIVQANLADIGIAVSIVQIDPGMFYDGSAGNDQNLSHSYWDMSMYKSVPSGPRPISFMATWYAGENARNVAQQENNWNGTNNQRYVSDEYDAIFEAAQRETDPEALIDHFIALNDHVISNHVIVPLVLVGTPRGVSRRLNADNISLAAFSYDYWNIANWNLVE